MMKYCDLHTHSICSDGSQTPSELVCEAKKKGLAAIALTDHNTVEGLAAFFAAAKEEGVEAIGGVELTTGHEGRELHLVGLFLTEKDLSAVETFTAVYHKRKLESNLSLLARLNRLLADEGYALDYEAMKAEFKTANLNRAHFAGKLIEYGVVASVDEAFKGILKNGNGYYEEAEKTPIRDAILFLRSLGAVPVLAHPFLEMNEGELTAFLPLAKEWGLMGMETEYSKFDRETRDKAKALAYRFGLLPSGGSDYHGSRKAGLSLGVGYGSLAVPYDYLEKLKEAKETL